MMAGEEVSAGGGRGMSAWGRAAVVVVAVGVVLRLAGIFDDFWFDEIWSWRIARSLGGVTDVLLSSGARIDNNHPLNTLLIYAMGEQAYWPVYRLPALLAGVATVVLAVWYVGRRFGRGEALAAAGLVGLSYPLIVYSSEARGYGLMVFFAVACFVAMDRFLSGRSWGMAVVFAGCAVLGFLSHLTFAHFYLAAVVWAGFRLVRESRSWGGAVIDFMRCHVVPVGFAAWLYGAFAAKMSIGGAPDTSLWGVVASALSLMAGGPADGAGVVFVAAVAGLAIVASLAVVWFVDRALFLFFVTCVVVSPAAFVVMQAVSMRGMETLFPRYFLVSMVFGYLLVAVAGGVVIRRFGRRGMIGVAVLLGCFAVGSLWQTTLFLRGTRGHYLDAVRYMVERSPGGVATVAGDNAFRTEMLLGFYAKYAPAGGSIVVTPLPPGGAPEWFVVNTPQAGVEPQRQLFIGGVPYVFDREFTYRGLSGWSWYVFRRQAP